ncbi:hypothetical protein LYSHEL_04200 [Lysobacter helvus]|uniref:Uncharacterized protein n=2 Tax=Lysobacteraceae TaxID=32033 RepID=A0ABN6FPS2_9GAMM|nr:MULTISPECIES: hypothetical protein [Lysobacter]BCT91396.1 hypothetical protein LYSCAS_04200 [Lysobacter caseinilyticus]BCT94549.1 hypothetical protein LYSHEL_04200 [Lysobacter helvus]
MGRKVAYAPRRGRARWFVLVGLALVGGVGYVAHQQANALAGQVLNVAFANSDTEIRGLVYPDWNGDVVASDVSLYLASPAGSAPAAEAAAAVAPDSADEAARLHFERLRITVPGGWSFFLANLVDMRLEKANLDGFKLAIDGFDSKAGVDPTLGVLGPIGAISASPFESEGCMQHAYFVRDELVAMGLKPGKTSLSYDVREANDRVTTQIVLMTPGVSRTQYNREETLAKDISVLHLADVATATHAESWDVSDQGFVDARNAWCAKQDGVDKETFVGRHLASVLRLLEVRGLVPDAGTVTSYRDFAWKGGQFAFGGTYASPLHSSERTAARRDGAAMLRLQAKVEHGAHNDPVQWRGTMPKPLAERGATFAAIVKEHGGVAPATGAPDPIEPPAPVVVHTANNGVRTASSEYASSFDAPTAPPGGRLAWEQLAQYQGHTLQFFTMHAEPRTATLVSVDGREAHVRARMEGGHADYRISREAFERALLIQ